MPKLRRCHSVLDTLTPAEAQAAMAAVQNMRWRDEYTEQERRLLASGDWNAIEAYATDLTGGLPVLPKSAYGKRLSAERARATRAFRGWHDHPLLPVVMQGTRAVMRGEHCSTKNDYGRGVFDRWARMAKLTAFDRGEFIERAGHYAYSGGRYGSNVNDLGGLPYGNSNGTLVWLRGKRVWLNEQQINTMRAMNAIIGKTSNLDKRMAMLRAYRKQEAQA